MEFTIKELESLSGIKAHTIRIWEQRYRFLKPVRTSTNIRVYNSEELKTLLTVALLNKYGYKISRIDEMQKEQRNNAVLGLQGAEAKTEHLINELVGFMVDLKSIEFEELLNKQIADTGLDDTIRIIFQFLEKVGLLWQGNKINVAQEHIVSNIIRQKIIASIDKISLHSKRPPLVLLFLPEYEHHELGLLFVYYLLRKEGIASIYLGANVPLSDLKYIVEVKQPAFLYTHLTSFPRQLQFKKFVNLLGALGGNTKILLSGGVVSRHSEPWPSNIKALKTLGELTSFISSL